MNLDRHVDARAPSVAEVDWWFASSTFDPAPLHLDAPSPDGADISDFFAGDVYTAAELCNLPPLEPLVDDVLFAPGLSVVYSPPKLGKTLLALDLALSVATGHPWMGRDVRHGPVVYVVAEGRGGIGARVQAWHDFHGRDAYVDDATFVTMAVNLMAPVQVRELCAFVKARRPVLTILDTLARCAVGAEENSAKDVGRIVESLDQIRGASGGHVCVVHHAGKDVSRGMRGSSALLGAVDTVLELSGDRDALRVAVSDQKDAEPVAPWWCRLQPVGGSVVIVQSSEDGEMLTKTQHTVLGALVSLAEEDRTSSKWEVMAEAHGVSRSAFFEAKKALSKAGLVAGGGGRGALYKPLEQESKYTE